MSLGDVLQGAVQLHKLALFVVPGFTFEVDHAFRTVRQVEANLHITGLSPPKGIAEELSQRFAVLWRYHTPELT